jgi:hypothetical protein
MNYLIRVCGSFAIVLLLMACSADTEQSSSSMSMLQTPAPQDATLSPPLQPTSHIITEQDNGQVFTYSITSRFTVELDDSLHPRSELQCLPEPIFGYISNGSNGGPGYPVRYEIGRAGACDLVSGDFRVKIIGAP